MSILSDWNIFLLNKLYFPTTNDYTGIDNFRYFERSPSGLFLHEMTILKNVLHFSRYGHNLIEDNFTDITISRCFWKLTSQGLEMLIVSTFLVSECYCVESVEIRNFYTVCQTTKYSNFAKILHLFQTRILLHKHFFCNILFW